MPNRTFIRASIVIQRMGFISLLFLIRSMDLNVSHKKCPTCWVSVGSCVGALSIPPTEAVPTLCEILGITWARDRVRMTLYIQQRDACSRPSSNLGYPKRLVPGISWFSGLTGQWQLEEEHPFRGSWSPLVIQGGSFLEAEGEGS